MLVVFKQSSFTTFKQTIVHSFTLGESFTLSFAHLDLFIYHVYSVLPACIPAGQKRAADLTTDVTDVVARN